MRDGRHFKRSESKKHTLGDLVDRYIRDVLPTKPKSERKQAAQLEWWKDQMGKYLLSDVTPALIVEHRDLLMQGSTVRGKQRSPSTVVRYMAVLSHAFTIAVKEWGWLDDSPNPADQDAEKVFDLLQISKFYQISLESSGVDQKSDQSQKTTDLVKQSRQAVPKISESARASLVAIGAALKNARF